MSCERICLCFPKFFKQLFSRKSISDEEMEIHNVFEFLPELTPIQLIGLGVGGIIGTGVFVLSGAAAAQYAGPAIIISFIIAGIVALLSALSLSEMSSMMSSCGSVYTYTYVALGEYPAFMMGWLSVLLYQLGASTVAVRWGLYVVHFIDLISDFNITSSIVEAPLAWSDTSNQFYTTGQVINLPAIAITIAICFVLIIGIRETAIVNLVFVVIKVIILLIFIIAGSMHIDRKNYDPFFPPNEGSFSRYGVMGMLHASTFVFFAFVGFEAVTTAAQEARQPSRSMPLALILSLVISLLIYVAVSTVMVGLVPYKLLLTTYPLVEAAKATPYGSWLPILLTLGAIAALTTVGITLLLAQSRIFYAMAHDGLLPSPLALIYHRARTPWVSILVCGVICALISGICPVDILGEMTSIAALITYMFVHLCVIVMYLRNEAAATYFKVPFGPWLVPILGMLSCILLLVNTSKGTAIRFGVLMAIGHVVYFSYSFWHSTLREQTQGNFHNNAIEHAPNNIPVIANPPHMNLGLKMSEESIHTIRL